MQCLKQKGKKRLSNTNFTRTRGAPEELAVPIPLVTPVMKLLNDMNMVLDTNIGRDILVINLIRYYHIVKRFFRYRPISFFFFYLLKVEEFEEKTRLEENKDTARTIYKVSRIAFPVAFFIFNVIYWTYFMTRT
jgi:hypothetical protein